MIELTSATSGPWYRIRSVEYPDYCIVAADWADGENIEALPCHLETGTRHHWGALHRPGAADDFDFILVSRWSNETYNDGWHSGIATTNDNGFQNVLLLTVPQSCVSGQCSRHKLWIDRVGRTDQFVFTNRAQSADRQCLTIASPAPHWHLIVNTSWCDGRQHYFYVERVSGS